MALSIGLKERRQRHRDARINAAVRIGITVLRDGTVLAIIPLFAMA